MTKILAPIVIFTEDDIHSIEISDTLCIRKITNEELSDFFGVNVVFEDQQVKSISVLRSGFADFWDDIPQGDMHLIGLGSIMYPYYILEASTREEIESFIFTIRLLEDKTIICPKGRSGTSTHIFRPFNFHPQVVLNAKKNIFRIGTSAISNIIEKYQLVHEKQSQNSILNARLNICMDYEQNQHVRFIESVSIVESILCGNDSGELSFRFSLFGSYLLQKLGISTTCAEVKTFYDIRSKLVHVGHAKKYNQEKLEEILKYSKLVYLAYLKDNISGDRILKEIEQTFGQVVK